ncbi:MAG: hypothetical protein GWN31_07545 [Candidatus Thorarchaeota archaeon]|nr:hypothetical protein [Candidatus Thorarchaeota archaeon]NIW13771.1 hypothetical protein [Candidatus Thorarchaeota archaeon]
MTWTDLTPEQMKYIRKAIDSRVKVELLPLLEALDINIDRLRALRITASQAISLCIGEIRRIRGQAKKDETIKRMLTLQLERAKQLSIFDELVRQENQERD